MVNITLPDGSIKQISSGTTGLEIANTISKSLANNALAIKVNKEFRDIYLPVNEDADVQIIVPNDKEGLEIIRHGTAHILAQAVKALFPEVQVTIGPVIEDGFYYDFDKKEPFTEKDLETIEAKMKDIVSQNLEVRREVWTRDQAIELFKNAGEEYKVEIISSIPPETEVSLYRQGDFLDLCRGPHSPSTKHSKHFKLLKVSGAYWRGDSKNPMLQRIYGTAWASKKDLEDYLFRIEEAKKRDHRKLGRELDLFHLQEEAKGMVFWHDKGWTIYRLIEEYIRNKIRQDGYHEVKTPMLVDRKIWEDSGHWEKFREHMFTLESEGDILALKPMNCPCHVQIFKQKIRSYRDLPMRMAEFGCCHRAEPSGALHGLMRVRGFVQDDAHIFCTEEQITSETIKFCSLLMTIYKDFGFDKVEIKFSDRPEKRAGSDEMWDKAEQALKTAVIASGYDYTLNPGEGAFYGPKLEFVLRDAIGRDWQCGTIQVDFVLPERLDAGFVSVDGKKIRPVMLHRAVIGSFERFIGILIEQYSGKFPIWLAPIQIAVVSITDDSAIYVEELHTKLINNNIRSELDISGQKINYKIRSFSLQKVPIIAIIGKHEAESGVVTLRSLGEEEQKVMKVEDLINFIKNKEKSLM